MTPRGQEPRGQEPRGQMSRGQEPLSPASARQGPGGRKRRAGMRGVPRTPAARIRAAAPVALAAALAVAGCGSTAAPAATPRPAPTSLPLATSLSSGQVTWAVVPMGAQAAGPEQFWELFARPAGATGWTLETPPQVATNGAIAVTVPGAATGQALIAGIRPSQALTFSPVTSTADGGRTWTPGGPETGLADVPDALAAPPAAGPLLALGRDGRAVLGGAASGTGLTSTSALAATPAGRACGLRELTGVAFSPTGMPLVAGDCTQAGVAGIFARAGGIAAGGTGTSGGGTSGTAADGAWQLAGPTMPAALRGDAIRVLRLTRSGSRLTALLLAGTGRSAVLVAAWMSAGAGWSVSAPLPVPAGVTSSSLGADGAIAVTLGGGGAALLPAAPRSTPAPASSGTASSGTASSGTAGPAWQQLPALPSAPHVTLALPAPGVVQALGTNNTVLTVWQLAAGGWTRVQRTTVPIQFGSST